MATGTTEAPVFNVESSSTEVLESIPGKIKATHIRDIYIKSDNEQNFFCNVIHLTCLDKNRIVVVDDAVSKESRFAFPKKQEAGVFRVKLVDTTRKQMVSVLDVPGKFSGITNINDTQLAICVDGNKIVLLRADTTITAEKSVKFPDQYDDEKYEITHLFTYEDDMYICSGKHISKVDMMGKKSLIHVFGLVNFLGFNSVHHATSAAMYTNAYKKFLYAITVDGHGLACLAHGTTRKPTSFKGHDMNGITTLEQGEPRFIVIDDERELLFVLLLVKNDYNWTEEHYEIYVLRTGTTEGCVLLGEADGLQDVTSMAYCSKTRQLFLGFNENNYVKVYQLSSSS